MKTIHSKTGVRELVRKFHDEHPRKREIAFLLQDWSDAYNVGGMFRVADALGAAELVLSGKTPAPPNPMIAVTSMGGHRRVPFTAILDNVEAALSLKNEGFSLVAVELADEAVSYLEFEWPEKVALVIGNEQRGVYGKVMQHVDAAVFLPMAGKGRSLNVHVAAAVIGFHVMYAAP